MRSLIVLMRALCVSTARDSFSSAPVFSISRADRQSDDRQSSQEADDEEEGVVDDDDIDINSDSDDNQKALNRTQSDTSNLSI